MWELRRFPVLWLLPVILPIMLLTVYPVAHALWTSLHKVMLLLRNISATIPIGWGQPKASNTPLRVIWLMPIRIPSMSHARPSRGRIMATQKPSASENKGMNNHDTMAVYQGGRASELIRTRASTRAPSRCTAIGRRACLPVLSVMTEISDMRGQKSSPWQGAQSVACAPTNPRLHAG